MKIANSGRSEITKAEISHYLLFIYPSRKKLRHLSLYRNSYTNNYRTKTIATKLDSETAVSSEYALLRKTEYSE